MADQHWTQHVKDVSISVRPDRDFPITTLILCEDDPEGPLHLLHFYSDGWIRFPEISRRSQRCNVRSSYHAHASLMFGEVYSDDKLYTRALYTFTISSLMDVSTTPRGEQPTTRYHVGNYSTTSSFPDVPSLMPPTISSSSSNYSGVVATSATWPPPSPTTPTSWLSV